MSNPLQPKFPIFFGFEHGSSSFLLIHIQKTIARRLNCTHKILTLLFSFLAKTAACRLQSILLLVAEVPSFSLLRHGLRFEVEGLPPIH